VVSLEAEQPVEVISGARLAEAVDPTVTVRRPKAEPSQATVWLAESCTVMIGSRTSHAGRRCARWKSPLARRAVPTAAC